FDNIGPALSFTPVQVEQYHAAARAVVKAVTSSRVDAPQLYAKLFGEHSPQDETPIETVRQLTQRWCDAAFRRPAGSAIVDKLLAIYEQSRAAKESHELAMGHVLTGILMSPQFLIRIEQNRGETPYRVDDYELASRLSFFLWSRPPDAQLLELAAAGKLGEPEVLARETRRMLRDAKSNALVKNFFGQWLGLRTLETHVVDADAFPEFNNELRRSMIAETDAFLAAMIVEDRPITELIDADYAFVDQRLAQFYGLTDATVSSDGPPVRIALKDRRRGGILTSAALLTLLADPNRTNIPRRGNYIADRILGMAPPPPPPNVPELEVARDGKPVPLRELFEKHRAQAACASCHARIDPFGFSLEQFDAIGRWRTTDAGQPIDASGVLPDGESLNGIVSLKDLLISRKEEFGRSMAKNLLIYALGRGPEFGDPCVIDDMAQAGAEHDWKFSELVLTIVNSRPFLYRRNPD
ncbi:MAG: DUF1592 domain-containing protein, partial [Planctomycetales bacterium]|nr:DUF1592 domain-containing protein [Planctomycetales bacterium]